MYCLIYDLYIKSNHTFHHILAFVPWQLLMFFIDFLCKKVIGMIFHRWETISHIISDTKLKWFERGAELDEEIEMDFGDNEENIGIIQFK